MAVKQSYAMVNGVKMLAIYDSATQLWTVEGNAPADSSWSQPNHVYKIELHAEDEAGNSTVMTADDGTYGNQLKLRVLEKQNQRLQSCHLPVDLCWEHLHRTSNWKSKIQVALDLTCLLLYLRSTTKRSQTLN